MWTPNLHPRYPQGHPMGGRFMKKGSADWHADIQKQKAVHDRAEKKTAKAVAPAAPVPAKKAVAPAKKAARAAAPAKAAVKKAAPKKAVPVVGSSPHPKPPMGSPDWVTGRTGGAKTTKNAPESWPSSTALGVTTWTAPNGNGHINGYPADAKHPHPRFEAHPKGGGRDGIKSFRTLAEAQQHLAPSAPKQAPKATTADEVRDLVVSQRDSGEPTDLDAKLAHLDDDKLRALHAEIAKGGDLYDRTVAKRLQGVLDRRAAKAGGGGAEAVASALHEDWRKTRLQPDGTFEPRVKKTTDQAWIDAHGGSDQVDIANTPYADLPEDWQAENRAAGEVVDRILKRYGGSVDLNNPAVRDAVGEEIHQEWLGRNDYARGGPLDVPFTELPPDEQAKDLDQLRIGMAATKGRPVTPAVAAARVKRSAKSRTEKAAGYPDRAEVPADKAAPSVPFPGYSPPSYTAPSVLAADRSKMPAGGSTTRYWADPADPRAVGHPFHSYEGPVEVDSKGRPVNPYTRTGVQDRGALGKWGANFAADPVVTRVNPDSGELEMASIKRGDNGQWAIPGGMVDDGEVVSAALAREFKEETGADLDMSGGREIYKGYVDDPRNTDNAWIETSAVHHHLSPEQAAQVTFGQVDDTGEIQGIQWAPVNQDMLDNLYASHGGIVRSALQSMGSDPSLTPAVQAQIQAALGGGDHTHLQAAQGHLQAAAGALGDWATKALARMKPEG